MPTFKPKKREPFKFTLEGKKYTVNKLTQRFVDVVGSGKIDDPMALMAMLTGNKKSDFLDADLFEIVQVVEWICSEMTPTGPDAKNG